MIPYLMLGWAAVGVAFSVRPDLSGPAVANLGAMVALYTAARKGLLGRKTVLWIIYAVWLLNVAVGAAQVQGLDFGLIGQAAAPGGLLSNRNLLGALIVAGMPAAGAVLGRWAAWVIVPAALVLAETRCRAAGVALLGMGAWWRFWQVAGRWERIYYGLLVAALVLVCAPMALEVKSVQYRAMYAVNCLPMIIKKPLTGYGAGTFQIVYQVWDEPIAQIPDAAKRSPKRLHNDWLQAAVEHGVIYAGMMFWMWAAWCVKAARRKDWAVSLSLGALGLVAAMDFPLQIPVHCAVFWMLGGVADRK